MRFHSTALVVVMGLCLGGFHGCGGGGGNAPAGESADAHHDEHDHAEEGPHGGHIIELGHEDYHAELTHDEAPRVGVHFLGSDAKTAKPIDAKSVMINVAAGGQATQYELPAVPQAGEAEGNSSYFELSSEPLHLVVSGKSETPGATARLSLTIDGKPYVGLIETESHDHDHGHEH